ncbi:MAG: MaoC/PaaZ C-terminal domain-containing protein [Armatimonadota bacterium]|nr:MaoC/PaaZ C-terminal domain-containing protein [Armatimonadota bacterium]MDR7485910.1 MaoC/PaaZ C-terminal domain-containing protein [Armatimonadota bacterium]MDR7533139.1 MaoC/PaaZ C-terminal domain-containing protein [Armatimonadota bacterium]MDR7536615.1 MaoC/PaaZ C-terminal domain-containing protein [Armatimonadota bacterium]
MSQALNHTLDVRVAALGRWGPEHVMTVDEAQIRAYAAALDDEHPAHRAGVVAPPLFVVVPVSAVLLPTLDGVLVSEEHAAGLHAAQDMRFFQPVRPGMVLRTRAAVIGVQPRRAGAAVIVRTAATDGTGAPVAEQYITLFLRRRIASALGEDAPAHQVPAVPRGQAPAASRVYRIAEDQPARYAAASGDRNPIHLDAAFARSAGLPGVVVHGMCTLGIASRLVVVHACGGDAARLARLAVRFARPVLPGQQVTVRLWAASRHGARDVYAFDALNPSGKVVLQDGLAEVTA